MNQNARMKRPKQVANRLLLQWNNFRSLSLQSLNYATGYRWQLYSPFVAFPKHGIAFLAIPRAGSSSAEFALTPLLGSGLDLTLPKYKRTFRHYMHNCSRRTVARHYGDFFKFTFVRNPWTRLYSCYLAKVVSYTNRHLSHLGLDKCRSFEDFALRVCDIPDEQSDMHFMSQEYLLTFEGIFLPSSVYRFELYVEGWQDAKERIEKQTGIQLNNLSHYYKSDSEHYKRAYSTRLVELVGERYRGDCERFGYTYPG